MKKLFRKCYFRRYLQDDEQIIYVVHRHIFSFLEVLLEHSIVLILFPLFIYFLFDYTYVLYAVIILCTIGIVKSIYDYLDWYFDVFILTDKNIVNVIWNGIFEIEVIRIDYGNVESVHTDSRGMIQSMFGYGLLRIDTHSEFTNVKMYDARDNTYAQIKILDIKDHKDDLKNQNDLVMFKKALKEFVEESLDSQE